MSPHLFVSDDGHLYDTRRPEWYKHEPLRRNYARIETNVDGNSIAIRAAIRQRYAWPGGYDLIACTSDGACLCMDCARKEYRQIAWSVRHRVNDGWRIVAIDATCNNDGPLDCDHCGRVLIEGETE